MPSVFCYSEDRQREILEAIPLRQGVDPKVVIAELTEAAMRMVDRKMRVRSVPSRNVVVRELNRLIKTLNALDPWVRRLLDDTLSEHQERQVCLDDITKAAARVVSERGWWFPSGKGSKSFNLSAEYFLSACKKIWRDCSAKPLPKSVKEGSPFARFCEAAIPDDLRTKEGASVTALINRVLDPDYIRRRHRLM